MDDKSIQIGGATFPLRVVLENRRSGRVALGKDAIIMRLPSQQPDILLAMLRTQMEEWLHRHYERHPEAFDIYKPADYLTGDLLRIGQRQYTLRLSEHGAQSSRGRLVKDEIHLVLSSGLQPVQRSKTIKSLLSRLVAKDFLPAIQQRVQELNAQHFRRPLQAVRLKYNSSNWGSCSGKANINLSTRLLFAPPDVVDYVIIHELAHLVHLHHGPAFWALVEKAMPDYEEKEKWLRDFGRKCDF